MSEENGNPENFPTTQDELNRIINNALSPKLARIKSLEAEKETVTQERDALKSTITERDGEITSLKSTVGDRDRQLLVAQVSHKKGVPARYITGDSQEDMESSADEFLTDARALGGPAGQKETAKKGDDSGDRDPQAGHVPSAGTGEEKPPRMSYDEIQKKAYEANKPH